MKKPQLKKIIKESVKEILVEQNNPANCMAALVDDCNGNMMGVFPCPHLNGNFLTTGDVGKEIQCISSAGQSPCAGMKDIYVITQVLPYPNATPTPPYSVIQLATPGCASTSGCPGWANYQNWVNTWTNLGPFNSTNPNQPCNFICSRIQQWSNTLTNAGPVQANQLQCKITEAQNQSQIHGCNC